MGTPFLKMHGLGNDFVVLDGREGPLRLSPERRRALADRHRGVGCDQLIVLDRSERADVAMRIYNPDGGEAEACGNATRCVATLFDRPVSIETPGGVLAASTTTEGVRVEMGRPGFDWQDIPLAYPMDTAALPLAWDELAGPMAVNVGNPHVVFFVADADAVPLDRVGPIVSTDPVFPDGVNVGVAQVVDGGLRLRVWERGAGLTQACGTGACAAGVAAIRSHRLAGPVAVSLPGGTLMVDWRPDAPVVMTGPATRVFEGTIDLEALA